MRWCMTARTGFPSASTYSRHPTLTAGSPNFQDVDTRMFVSPLLESLFVSAGKNGSFAKRRFAPSLLCTNRLSEDKEERKAASARASDMAWAQRGTAILAIHPTPSVSSSNLCSGLLGALLDFRSQHP